MIVKYFAKGSFDANGIRMEKGQTLCKGDVEVIKNCLAELVSAGVIGTEDCEKPSMEKEPPTAATSRGTSKAKKE